MDEPQWQGSAEEYRTIQGLARNKRYHEAIERAERALRNGQLGRKHAARLHAMLMRMYVEDLQQTGPVAVLHGEEAVRMARLVRDAWIQCEAQSLLVIACCHMLDVARARLHCDMILAEVERNPQVITGGMTHVLLLQSRVAWAAGDEQSRLTLLQQAEDCSEREASSMWARVRLDHIACLIDQGRPTDAQEQFDEIGECAAAAIEWELTRAWLQLEQGRPEEALETVEDVLDIAQQTDLGSIVAACYAICARAEAEKETARRMARMAMHRAVGAGRLDLARRFRTWLEPLL